jgi:hypothetical protein
MVYNRFAGFRQNESEIYREIENSVLNWQPKEPYLYVCQYIKHKEVSEFQFCFRLFNFDYQQIFNDKKSKYKAIACFPSKCVYAWR